MENLDGRLCELGCGRPARFVLKMGKTCCEKDARSCPEMRRKNSESKKGKCPKWPNGHPQGMAGKTAWNKDKTYDEIFGTKRSREIRDKISNSPSRHNGRASTEEKERQRRRNLSLSMKQSGKSGGYRRTSGRGKHGWYRGIWCDSSWELAWVMFHLDHGIPFKRNRDRFEYEWNGETHRYLPDFKMSDGQYVEVKAWLNEQGKAKLAACPGVSVLMKNEMEPFIRYAVEKYGKDFVKLYDKGEVR